MSGETSISEYLKSFSFTDSKTFFPGKATRVEMENSAGLEIPYYINEFWTPRQRQASSVHEISYRACFKPQLARFFIDLLTAEGDLVYDPFSGRGTTIIEAALLDRRVISNDINPLSKILAAPRLALPSLEEVEERLEQLPAAVKPGQGQPPQKIVQGSAGEGTPPETPEKNSGEGLDLSMFYHRDTEDEIKALRKYLIEQRASSREDDIDRWIRMVATNRLTGHSSGFFSVYTLPPNQAVSVRRQVKINAKRNQVPDYRDTRKLIQKKTKSLLRNLKTQEINNLRQASLSAVFLEKDARETCEIPPETVQLTVTSPPFLDIVQYSQDNWLRCWFNDIDMGEVEKKITMIKEIEKWCAVMAGAFKELYRITQEGGWVAFEVGEVKKGKIRLDEYIIPLGLEAGFNCEGVLINLQNFTKTSNIWGINNNRSGTNTNRIVLFYK